MNKSKGNTRFYIYAVAFLPFILLLASGLILLKYHTGAASESIVLGFDGHFWKAFHKLSAFIATPLVLLHLIVKTSWVKRLFTLQLKGAFKTSNILLFVLFLLCFLSGFGSAIISNQLGGIHNKFGLLLLILFLIHLWNYQNVIINQLKKINESKVAVKKETIKIGKE